MISIKQARKFCKEDISKIENYEQAMADKSQTWDCHHRDEIRVLPSGLVALRTKEELKESGRYFGCPANELIFMTHADHAGLHAKYKDNTNFFKRGREHKHVGRVGLPCFKSDFNRKYWEHYHLLAKDNKTQYQNEVRFYKKYKVVSWEFEGVKNSTKSEFGRKFVEHFGIRPSDDTTLYNRELRRYYKTNKCSWEANNG